MASFINTTMVTLKELYQMLESKIPELREKLEAVRKCLPNNTWDRTAYNDLVEFLDKEIIVKRDAMERFHKLMQWRKILELDT